MFVVSPVIKALRALFADIGDAIDAATGAKHFQGIVPLDELQDLVDARAWCRVAGRQNGLKNGHF
jgi:hypothetical protein